MSTTRRPSVEQLDEITNRCMHDGAAAGVVAAATPEATASATAAIAAEYCAANAYSTAVSVDSFPMPALRELSARALEGLGEQLSVLLERGMPRVLSHEQWSQSAPLTRL